MRLYLAHGIQHGGGQCRRRFTGVGASTGGLHGLTQRIQALTAAGGHWNNRCVESLVLMLSGVTVLNGVGQIGHIQRAQTDRHVTFDQPRADRSCGARWSHRRYTVWRQWEHRRVFCRAVRSQRLRLENERKDRIPGVSTKSACAPSPGCKRADFVFYRYAWVEARRVGKDR